ncbi:chain-length determining protein [Pseudomonas veronii]|uniref:Wzz/FepE/Etk N-terminal domain-containing protein n=1 Tax=Pseudomonas TaxID=286 RepID=UPI000F833B17|nr:MULTISPECIES: Wzz/FepE/Etk N-terminal domain-containing protein [Pseudomonas]MDY7551982.1 Wzz/FepE/Etk N-terminal domain-containing protein [Pseudomonas sp. FG1]MEB0052113.1 Wzz/FepE/Etk N-terminal domain-containing protein [Pseudomonas sp. FG1]RTY65687.1 chain-length determining protein [Pseudomonas veronii]
MSSSFRAPAVTTSAEIDLLEISKFVWQQKKLLLLVALGGGLIAASYAFLATPEYKISTVLRPAAVNELDALNRSEIYQLPPSEALIEVGSALDSYDVRLAFFRDNQRLFEKFVEPGRTLEQSFEEFNRNSIRLILPEAEKKNTLRAYVKLEMTYPKDIDGVAILNGFVDYAINVKRMQISLDLNTIIKNRISELKGKFESARSNYSVEKEARIASLREADSVRHAQLQDELKALRSQLRNLRNDRIAQLSESISIAKSLGIHKPTTPSSLGEQMNTNAASVMRTEISNQQVPLYFMGTEALKAELAALHLRRTDDFTDSRIAQIAKELQMLAFNREVEVLSARKNEDVFLADVQPLRAEIARLSNLSIDVASLKLASIDQQALEPLKPSSPNRLFVVMFGVLAGLILAVGIVLVKYAFLVSAIGVKADVVKPPSQGRTPGDALMGLQQSSNKMLQ